MAALAGIAAQSAVRHVAAPCVAPAAAVQDAVPAQRAAARRAARGGISVAGGLLWASPHGGATIGLDGRPTHQPSSLMQTAAVSSLVHDEVLEDLELRSDSLADEEDSCGQSAASET